MAKVCISGYYGYDSIEHELMLLSLVNALRRQANDMEIVVFSAAPEKTEDTFDVVAVDSANREQLKQELKTADLLICGGGHLLKETEDLGDIKYYVKLMKTALHLDLPVFIYHQTFLPYASSRAKAMVASVLKKVRKISVSDRESADVLQDMGLRRGRIHVTEDPLLVLGEVDPDWNLIEIDDEEKKALAQDTEGAEATVAEKKTAPINYDGMDVEIEIRIVDKVDPDPKASPAPKKAKKEEPAAKTPKSVPNRPQNLARIVPAFWKKPGEKFAAFILSLQTEFPVTQVTAMADYMIEQGFQVVFLPLHYPEDMHFAKEIMSLMEHPAYDVAAMLTPQALFTAIKEVDFVFTSEYYPMLISAVCKKPFVSLCHSEQSEHLVTELGLTPAGNLSEYDGEAFVRNFKAAVADPAAIVHAVEEHLPAIQENVAFGDEQLEMIFAQIERKRTREERAGISHTSKSSGLEFPTEQLKGIFSFGKKKNKSEDEPAWEEDAAEEALEDAIEDEEFLENATPVEDAEIAAETDSLDEDTAEAEVDEEETKTSEEDLK